jgi:hypothetical protein
MKNFLDEKIEKLDALQKTAAETYLEWKKSEREWDEKMRREIVSKFGAPFWGAESEEDEE